MRIKKKHNRESERTCYASFVKYVLLRGVWDYLGRKSVWVVILHEILYTDYKKNKAAE